MKNSRGKYLLAAAAGLSLAGSAAGCSSTPAAEDPGSNADTGTGEYADGTYSAVGSYRSPNGDETIDVTMTLSDNQVADVAVTSHPTNPYTRRFQGEFVDGIQEEVVGKPIDELDVTRVGGSSLTSDGFRDAVEKIKSEAQL